MMVVLNACVVDWMRKLDRKILMNKMNACANIYCNVVGQLLVSIVYFVGNSERSGTYTAASCLRR